MGRVQCEILSRIDSVKLIAIADRSAESLSKLPEALQQPHVKHYAECQDLLTNEQPDLVSVATNTASHLALGKLIAEAGIPRLIIEKPIGNNITQAIALNDLCQSKGCQLVVNQSRRWSPDYASIKQYLSYGLLGELRHISAILGEGGVAMIGVHFLDLMRYLMGQDVARVTGYLEKQTASNKWGAEFYDPGGYGIIEFKNGGRGFIELSTDLVKRERFLVLRCENGRIEIDERARRWTAVMPNSRRVDFQFRQAVTPEALFRKMIIETLKGEPSKCDGQQGIAALEMVMAMHVSSQRGHIPIDLPLTPEDAELRVNFP
ncbi:MAG: Gfo/Idh/MocA family oxidoreductase [Anaerolineae bacterium]|nr:Gfo/Idh/MocA family oxidoreductase [Anaerolineae bacterium]